MNIDINMNINMNMRVIICFSLLALIIAIQPPCPPGYFYWAAEGIKGGACSPCPAGCACSGFTFPCTGCNSGLYSATVGASVCSVCPIGTTTDIIFNSGCDHTVLSPPCQNKKGPLGFTECKSAPPVPVVNFTAPSGILPAPPPQYLTGVNGVPTREPPGPLYIVNQVPPYYNVTAPGIPQTPLIQQSY